MKSILFESGDLVQNVGYPLKVTTNEDIESAAFLAYSPGEILGSHGMIPTIVSRMTERVTGQIHGFINECISHGGTTKIFDADGLTELSQDDLVKKY